MQIRKAAARDIPSILRLLVQVNMVHHKGRPDLFKAGGTKYGKQELRMLLEDESRPILVAADEADQVVGYAFCILQQHHGEGSLADIKTLYIDDLCVDELQRGRRVGTALYESVLAFARENGCYNVTLNVWTCNESAMRFYESCGLKPQKIGLEQIL